MQRLCDCVDFLISPWLQAESLCPSRGRSRGGSLSAAMEPWKRRLFSARRRVFALWLALCCCCVSAFGGSLLAEASRLGGKRKGAACLGAPLCAPRRSIPGSLCCLSAPLDFARRLFSGALHSSAEFPSQSSSSPSSTAPLLAARPPPPSSSASDDLPLNSASSQTDAAEAERAVEEAASWFEAQQKLWSDRAAKLLGLMLEERRHARELQASARASGDSSAKKVCWSPTHSSSQTSLLLFKHGRGFGALLLAADSPLRGESCVLCSEETKGASPGL